MGYCYVIRSRTKDGRPKYLRLTDNLTSPECPWTDDRKQAARFHTRVNAESAAITICSTWAMSEASHMRIVRLRPKAKPAAPLPDGSVRKWVVYSDRGYWAGHSKEGSRWAQDPVYAMLYEERDQANMDAECILFEKHLSCGIAPVQVTTLRGEKA